MWPADWAALVQIIVGCSFTTVCNILSRQRAFYKFSINYTYCANVRIHTTYCKNYWNGCLAFGLNYFVVSFTFGATLRDIT